MSKIEKQHSELLVEFMDNTTHRNLPGNFKVLKSKYKALPEKPRMTSDNPFVDEICSKWLANVLRWYFEPERQIKDIQVSQLPPLEELTALNPPGFGTKTKKEYAAILSGEKKYKQ